MPNRKKSNQRTASGAWDFGQLEGWRIAGGVALVCVLVLFAYWRAISGGFIWDDEPLVTQNDLIKAPNGLYRIWFTTEAIDYWPVTNSVFWVEYRLWGNHTAGYHLTNVVLHICNALLVWAVLRRLAMPGAYLAGLLFAVHPVNVESVAWIAQQKNTLSLFFCLISAWCYLQVEVPEPPDDRMNAPGTGRWYWLSLLTYALGMLSKGSVIVLPALLLLVIWWRRGIGRWDIGRLAPFFVLGVGLTGVNVWFQTHGEEIVIRSASGVQRLLGAAGVIWFYLSKALLPINLTFIYPQWDIRADDFRWWLPLGVAIVVTSILWWQRRTRVGRALLLAWGFFCVGLAPVMGFVDVIFMKYSLVADHYQYLAIIGVVAAMAAGWSLWHEQVGAAAKRGVVALAVVVTVVLTMLSFAQAGDYRDAVTLYQAIVRRNPECWSAYNNLGNEMDALNRVPEAIENYRKALELNPGDAEAENNLGSALLKSGKADESISHFNRSIELNPSFASAHYNLGSAQARLGRTDEAMKEYQAALRLLPDSSMPHYNLAQGFYSIEKWDEAIAEFKKALALDPGLAPAENSLGSALMRVNQPEEAIVHFRRALQIDSNFAGAHGNLGGALFVMNRVQDAITEFRVVTRLEPENVDGYANLALALAKASRADEAIAAAQKGMSVAQAQGNMAKAGQIEAWLRAYQTKSN